MYNYEKLHEIGEKYWAGVYEDICRVNEKYLAECDINYEAIKNEYEMTKIEYDYLFDKKMWGKIDKKVYYCNGNEDFAPNTTLSDVINNYIENGEMWEDFIELYPNYTAEQEEEYDKNSEKFYNLF